MTRDPWASWLLSRRDAGSDEMRARVAPDLVAYRDGVLDRAGLRPDDVLLDVGCGTGLIGGGALDRLGPAGRVIFSDISDELLARCRASYPDERGTFVRAAADDLSPVPDGSVNVVTTRSVLIYCDRPAAAFAEFFRVLRPGGRVSIFEPINRFRLRHRPDDPFGLSPSPDADADHLSGAGPPIAGLLAKVAGQMPTPGDFDERDLLGWAAAAGFGAVELDYRAQLEVPAEPLPPWSTLREMAPNPLAPTYREATKTALTEDECARLDAYLNAVTAAQRPSLRTIATAYLRAVRPSG